MTIQQHLSANCQAFIDLADSLSEEQFHTHVNEKWSVAEVMQHLYLSARPVARLMSGPREVLLPWGKADWPSRTYTELASAYSEILGTGAKAPVAMSPRLEDMQVEKSVLVERFTGIYQALVEAITTWSEQELATYCIPHPVLGKLTVQEMLIFTDIHTQHHLRLLPEV
ncbi:DinB family protein [Spirosoma sp. KCTC 42546]|uniref:DinB family protein n=1 Tax=Spirosoma sp. KCTC 42546 TaxID=2520506 RepID=UPI001157516C|nr:DinB family protein [Spirosoma sp. KCTC 42546]QDK80955.1 DinB family protein [Spirosoma sp. KCTC 42546]